MQPITTENLSIFGIPTRAKKDQDSVMKFTLTLLFFITKFQGRDSKYYTIQKTSLLISSFFSLFVMLAINIFDASISRELTLFLFFLIWVLGFSIHYIWFLKSKKSNWILHYKEYKNWLKFYLVFFILFFAMLFVLI